MLAYEEFESRFLVPRIYGRALRLPSSVVLVALLAGGTLMGIVGALLALPVAAAMRMLVDELRVELPGEVQTTTPKIHARDDGSSANTSSARRAFPPSKPQPSRWRSRSFGATRRAPEQRAATAYGVEAMRRPRSQVPS